MMFNIYAIYDSKAKAYLQPFFFPQTGMALRAFTDSVNNPESQFNKHPEDYSLATLGDWDDTSGELRALSVETVVTALQVLQDAAPSEISQQELDNLKP